MREMMDEEKIQVIRQEDGKIGSIPIEDLYKALQSNAYQLSNPQQRIAMQNSQGKVGSIPAEDFVKAIDSQQYQYVPKANPIEKQSAQNIEGDNIAQLIGKSILSGALELADLPQALLSLGEMGLIAPINALGGNVKPVIGSLSYPSEYVKEGLKGGMGIDIEPHPTSSGEKILSRGIQEAVALPFGGALGKFAKPSAVKSLLGAEQGLKKLGTLGGAIGTTAQALEEGGVNPLAANLGTSLGIPALGGLATSTKNLARNLKPSQRAANKLQELVGNENIPQVIDKLQQQGLLGINPTSAELAGNQGLNSLYRNLQPNSTVLGEAEAANNAILRNTVSDLAPKKMSSPEIGEILRDEVGANLNEALANRAAKTEPLFAKVQETNDPILLDNLEGFLGKRGVNASKSTEALIDSVRKEFNKSLGEAETWDHKYVASPLGLAEDVRQTLLRLSKDKNNLKDKGFFQTAERALRSDIKKHKTGSKHIDEYAKHSKPISEIREADYLKKIVKQAKDGSERYTHNSVELPSMVLEPSLRAKPYTDALLKQASLRPDNNLLDAIKAHSANSLESSIYNSGMDLRGGKNLSYPKLSKYLTEKGAGLESVLGSDYSKLQDLERVLGSRNVRDTANRALGSPTASNLAFSAASDLGQAGVGGLAGYIPGGKWATNIAKQALNQRYTNHLEKGLVSPSYLEQMLTTKNNPATYISKPALLHGAKKGKKLSDEEINKKLQETQWLTDEERRDNKRRKVPTISSMPYVDVPTVGRR